MITFSDWLTGISFLLTILLIGIGFARGFDIIEISLYYLYFIINIINQVIYLEKKLHFLK